MCEEITRFIFERRNFVLEFKKIRHDIDALIKRLKIEDLLKYRRSSSDVGRTLNAGELSRRDYREVFFANIQRVKEALRVLEEFTKLNNYRVGLGFKKIRYCIYELEKKVAGSIKALRNYR